MDLIIFIGKEATAAGFVLILRDLSIDSHDVYVFLNMPLGSHLIISFGKIGHHLENLAKFHH